MRIGLKFAMNRIRNHRRQIAICWPDPDATCLEGGCVHCQDAKKRTEIKTVATYAEERGLGEEFAYGLMHKWPDSKLGTGRFPRD